MIQVCDFNHVALNRIEQSSVTIGNFDGCHLGHQQLIATALGATGRQQLKLIAVTFEPRPEAYFRRLPSEPLLFTDDQKTRSLGELGVELQVVQPFNQAFSQVTHIEFYRDYLRDKLRAATLVIGDDFHFGHQRRGDAAFLREQTSKDGVELTIGSAVHYAKQRISSTRLRETINVEGDVTAAALMLGRPYLLEGVVEKGDQLGRRIGVPTANLGQVSQLLPRYGVYAGYVWLASEGSNDRPPVTSRASNALPAVFNVGIRPTVATAQLPVRIEAHLLAGEYGADALYGVRAGYYFSHRLRGEAKFVDLQQLQNQITLDIQQARTLLTGG